MVHNDACINNMLPFNFHKHPYDFSTKSNNPLLPTKKSVNNWTCHCLSLNRLGSNWEMGHNLFHSTPKQIEADNQQNNKVPTHNVFLTRKLYTWLNQRTLLISLHGLFCRVLKTLTRNKGDNSCFEERMRKEDVVCIDALLMQGAIRHTHTPNITCTLKTSRNTNRSMQACTHIHRYILTLGYSLIPYSDTWWETLSVKHT